LQLLYNLSVWLVNSILPLTKYLSPKMKKFVDGRKESLSILNLKLKKDDDIIWFHVASLGEFEQGLPIIEAVKKLFPHHKILVSFFSPSGFEVKKNSSVADAVVYLPIDTKKNVRMFLDAAHPELAIFIKYEFWPNYLKELKSRNITSLLISAGFRENQMFFQSYGSWMKKSLLTFDHFFVQNKISKDLLNSIGFQNVTVSGDTRFDRVTKQIGQDNHLDFIEAFKDNKICVVAGSTWPEDEALLEDFINQSSNEIKFIIAPHNIKPDQINSFKGRLNKKTILYSEKETRNLSNYQVFIIDTIGLLSKIYSYADIAYVGGAAGNTGLHNILEPATFGIPLITGTNFDKFPEAKQLQELGGLYAVGDNEEFAIITSKLLRDEDFRVQTGMIARYFVENNTGATRIVEEYLKNNYVKRA